MDAIIESLRSDDVQKKIKVLHELSEKLTKTFKFPELNKHDYRAKLWITLYKILEDPNQSEVHLLCLVVIRILSREKVNLNELIHDDLLNLIISYTGLKDNKAEIYQENEKLIEALKCLCNILFNADVPRALCYKNGLIDGIFNRLHMASITEPIPIDIQILDMKILFILTALNSETRVKINCEMNGLRHLIEVLDGILKQHGLEVDKSSTHEFQDKQIDLLSEILKTLFNLTVAVEDENKDSVELVKVLRDYLLVEVKNISKKLELHNHIVNLLINIPENDLENLMIPIEQGDVVPDDIKYEDMNMAALKAILDFLQSRFHDDPTISKQHEVLSPVLTLLKKCASSNRKMRKYLRNQVLPPLRDVFNRPEEGKTSRNYLCRLLTTPITQVRDLAADLLFILCKENVSKMIKYTGYGNAAGMFAKKGLLGGKNGETSRYSSDSEDSDTEEYTKYKDQINPVMGCFQPARPNPTENMTEEQKEYEAMKLVDLMNQLTRSGIVKPATIGKDGKPKPLEHVLQLQENVFNQQMKNDDSDDE